MKELVFTVIDRLIYGYFRKIPFIYRKLLWVKRIYNSSKLIKFPKIVAYNNLSDEECDLTIYEKCMYRTVFQKKYWNESGVNITETKEPTLPIYVAEMKTTTIVFGDTRGIYIPNRISKFGEGKWFDDQAKICNDLRFSSESIVFDQYNDKENIVLVSPKDTEMRHIKKAITILGPGYGNLFHYITECLTRLRYVDDEKYAEYPILIDKAVNDNSNYMELLNMILGKQREIIVVNNGEGIIVEQLIFPSYHSWMPMHVNEGYAHNLLYDVIGQKGLLFVRDRLQQNTHDTSETTNDRFFFSRKKCRNKRLKNEDEVEEVFREFGFISICPEDYAVQDLIMILNNAKYIAGSGGAALTNAIFCKEGTKGFIIAPREHCSHSWAEYFGNLEMEFIGIDAKVLEKGKESSDDQFVADICDVKLCLNKYL